VLCQVRISSVTLDGLAAPRTKLMPAHITRHIVDLLCKWKSTQRRESVLSLLTAKRGVRFADHEPVDKRADRREVQFEEFSLVEI
jgi:hypothetical protein